MTATPLPENYEQFLKKLKVHYDYTLDELFTDFEQREGLDWTAKFDQAIHTGNSYEAHQLLYTDTESAQASHTMTHNVSPEWLAQIQTLPKDGTALDVGCGTGVSPLFLAEQRPDLKIYAFDFSPNAIERAKERAEQLKLNNITFFTHKIYEPLPQEILNQVDGEFDVVLSHCLLHEVTPDLDDEWERELDYLYEYMPDETLIKGLMRKCITTNSESPERYVTAVSKYLNYLKDLSRQYVCTVERLPNVLYSAIYALACDQANISIYWEASRKSKLKNACLQREESMPLWVLDKTLSEPKQNIQGQEIINNIYQLHH